MAIRKFTSGESLRFATLAGVTVASFLVISDDIIQESKIEVDAAVLSPIYGDPYLRLSNSQLWRFTRNSIQLEGTEAAFTALEASLVSGMQILRFLIGPNSGGTEFFRGVVTGVSTKKNVLRGAGKISGTVQYIKVP
jgi:hypothetical protein